MVGQRSAITEWLEKRMYKKEGGRGQGCKRCSVVRGSSSLCWDCEGVLEVHVNIVITLWLSYPSLEEALF